MLIKNRLGALHRTMQGKKASENYRLMKLVICTAHRAIRTMMKRRLHYTVNKI